MADTSTSPIFRCWYHGNLTKTEAELRLTGKRHDCFLIRESERALILSLIHHGRVHHINIKRVGQGWYELDGVGSAVYSFSKLEDLVSHYHCNAISDDLKITLGIACEREAGEHEVVQDQRVHSSLASGVCPVHDSFQRNVILRIRADVHQ